MKMALPAQGFDFDFAFPAMATSGAPYGSAPSSPRRLDGHVDLLCHCVSAPASPTRAAAIYQHFRTHGLLPPPPSSAAAVVACGVPFDWEEKPGTPKSRAEKVGTQDDALFGEGFTFPPLKPPPCHQYPGMMDDGVTSSPARSPRSPRPSGLWPSGCNQQQREGAGGCELDPFTIAMVQATREKGPTTTTTFVGQSKPAKWRLLELLLPSAPWGKHSTPLPSSWSSSNKKVAADDVAKIDGGDCIGKVRAPNGEVKKKARRQRQGLLSCIRFNLAGHCHSLSRARRCNGD